MYQHGDTLKDEEGNKYKILGVCGDMVFLSRPDNHTQFLGSFVSSKLEELGYTKVQEKFVPQEGEEYFHVDSFLSVGFIRWAGDGIDKARLSIGNCFRTEAEAEKYKQHLLGNPYQG